MSQEGDIVKITIILFVIAAIMFFVAGCGPGQPFEIEDMYTSQTDLPVHVVAARQVPVNQVKKQDSGNRSTEAVSLLFKEFNTE